MNRIERMLPALFAAASLALAAPVSAQDDLPMPVESSAALERAEIEQLLAPIALYPDAVLTNVLVAATYPLEIVQAARWSRDNPDLQGEAAVEAVEDRNWDPSVKALVAFPELLARMDEDLEWTQRLGDAMLMQEDEVMAAIQSLRERAYAANTLDQVEHITVRRVVNEERPAERVIVIEPADPQVVYVPVYRPTVVYGGWHWPHHAPYHWAPPVHYHHYHAGFYWGRGIHYAPAYWFGAFDWHRHVIVVNVNRFKSRPHPRHRRGFRPPEPPGVWQHDPRHRRGVPYATPRLQRQFGRMPVAAPGELHPRPRPTVRSVRAQVAAAPARTAAPRVSAPRTVAPARPRAAVPNRAATPRGIQVVEDRPRTRVDTRGPGPVTPRATRPVIHQAPARQAAPARRAPVVQMPQVRRGAAPAHAPRIQARDMPTVDRGRSLGPAPVRAAPPRAQAGPRQAAPARARAAPAAPPRATAPAPTTRKQGPARQPRDQER